MSKKKLAGWIAAPLVIAAIGVWYAIQQLEAGICGNTVGQTVVSPDGQLQAVVFERDCGATTGFSTQVSILRANQPLPNEGGSVFVTDAPDASALPVVWTGARTLQIQYPAQTKVFYQATAAGVSLGLFRRAVVAVRYRKSGGP